MGTSNRDRQAAFKERMRLEGKVMRTLWLDQAQEKAVKGFLVGKALPVTGLQSRIDEMEVRLASLSQELVAARGLEQQAQQECSSLRRQHEVAARDMRRLSEELKAAKSKTTNEAEHDAEWRFKMLQADRDALRHEVSERDRTIRDLKEALAESRKTVSKGVSLSAPKAGERAKILLEQINQTTSWRGETRERDALGTRQAVDRLASLVRQAKTARTAIAKAEAELADIVTDGEKQVLGFARIALSQILDAADLAKEQGRRLAKKREDHEKACAVAANKAVSALFQPESIEDQIVLIMAPGKPDLYSAAHGLVIGEAFKRMYRDPWGKEIPQDILASTLADAVRIALDGLRSRVRGGIADPTEAQTKALEIQAEIVSKRPALLAEHDGLIRRIKAELVARRLEKVATQEVRA